MSDLYHIPNDDGKTYRLKKFVEYQHEVPSTHYRFVAQYCKDEKMDKNAIVNMAFLLSATYSEITTVFIAELLKEYSYEQIWAAFADKLNFGSARKYMKMEDRFVIVMAEWEEYTKRNYYEYIKRLESRDPIYTYNNIQNDITKLNGVGRFASETFLELIVFMKDALEINVRQPARLEWKTRANLTSGIYNIFYEDEKANEFDKTGKVTKEQEAYLTIKLKKIQQAIHQTYPEQDSEIAMFIGKICSFRNLFKGARYGGFHHDRELGVIKAYQEDFPKYERVWQHCYQIRKEIFAHRLLGELNGWDGIRKDRKKLWLTTGRTGAEDERPN